MPLTEHLSFKAASARHLEDIPAAHIQLAAAAATAAATVDHIALHRGPHKCCASAAVCISIVTDPIHTLTLTFPAVSCSCAALTPSKHLLLQLLRIAVGQPHYLALGTVEVSTATNTASPTAPSPTAPSMQNMMPTLHKPRPLPLSSSFPASHSPLPARRSCSAVSAAQQQTTPQLCRSCCCCCSCDIT
jgi:hypothetical protein